MSVTFLRGASSVTWPDYQHGDALETDYNIKTGETDGGQLFAEDPGHKTQRWRWNWVGITDDQKRDWERFYENILENGLLTFIVGRANPYTTLLRQTIHCGYYSTATSDFKSPEYMIRCGMVIDGVFLKCGYVPLNGPDNLYWFDVRCIQVAQWQNVREWTWTIELEFFKQNV